ncbi:hypothetical protein Gogos_020200 [Gossypium gossypioides]|uniref:Uncharacterized protein n=1 Tax=Gossypium gossypioides TaxID=34282 RepID=A0A7J9CZU7_GOSGO|nr:hypothetical protein [Gossypium gossypioides]
MILNTFSLIDAKRTLCIILAIEAHEDMLVWGGEASGEFSARSAYKLSQKNPMGPNVYALQIVNEPEKISLIKTKKVVEWKKHLGTVIKINFDGAYDR